MVVNRNKVVKWFITFPHSGSWTPQSFTEILFSYPGIVAVAGCQETHEDGVTPHIHINIHLEQKYGLTKAQLLRKITAKFPDDFKRIDIRPTYDSAVKARDGYLSKEDANVWFWNSDVRDRERRIKRDIQWYNKQVVKMMNPIVWGIIDEDKSKSKWNPDASILDNLLNGDVIFSVEAQDPWWELDDGEL